MVLWNGNCTSSSDVVSRLDMKKITEWISDNWAHALFAVFLGSLPGGFVGSFLDQPGQHIGAQVGGVIGWYVAFNWLND